MKEKFGWGLIGYGGMGKWHTNFALKSDVVELVGIYDIDPIKNAQAVENGIFAYESLEAVLADPKVDIITIATPNDVHKEIAVKALDAGKNVISGDLCAVVSSFTVKE